ncbi:DUF6053 domain-containing protein [Lysobacter enzymogenes]|uniref:DUF6053 domain-containing protein n=1 Tax=Lysobacter enzymogenes TaxID=69 RepID=UPI003CCD2F2E
MGGTLVPTLSSQFAATWNESLGTEAPPTSKPRPRTSRLRTRRRDRRRSRRMHPAVAEPRSGCARARRAQPGITSAP